MILYPAIDLKDGQCVRLLRGQMADVTVFSDNPGDQARSFEAAGFEWTHVVDLNGAFAGKPVNDEAVEAIRGAVKIPIQLGGGIRDRATIDHWLSRGIDRLILGTTALRDPAFVKRACRDHPGRIAIGIDARDGRVAVEGWAKTSDMLATDLAKAFEDAGAVAIIYTDISRDGAMQGPNVEATAALARRITTPVIASGGISCHDDLAALKAEEDAGIAGVICGRALYDGRVEADTALALMAA